MATRRTVDPASAVQVEKPVAGDEQTRLSLQSSIQELEGEIVTLKKLSHPNIVRYYGCERTDQHINIFLEWVPCGSIRKLLDEHGVH
jgi:serine/threonine protein kinase